MNSWRYITFSLDSVLERSSIPVGYEISHYYTTRKCSKGKTIIYILQILFDVICFLQEVNKKWSILFELNFGPELTGFKVLVLEFYI